MKKCAGKFVHWEEIINFAVNQKQILANCEVRTIE